MIRVLLADRHKLLYPGIRAVFSTSDEIKLVGTVDCEHELEPSFHRLRPDVLVLSLAILEYPSKDYLCKLQTICPKTKILVLLCEPNEFCSHQLLELGFDGIILKSDLLERLIEAIRMISTGQKWVSPVLISEFLPSRNRKQRIELTERQLQVLQAIASDKSDKEVAKILGIKQRTIRYHLECSNNKLGTTTRVGAIAEAMRRNLIK